MGECAFMMKGAGAGICAYTIVWHTHGYLLFHDNLARVSRDAREKEVERRDRLGRSQLFGSALIKKKNVLLYTRFGLVTAIMT